LPFFAAFLQAQSLVHDFTPQDISNLMWAYAKLGVRPPQMLLVALWESVGIISAASSSSSSDGSSGSSSYGSSSSGAGVYGSTAIPGSSGGSVGARLSAFKPQELTMLVWALAVLKLVPGMCLQTIQSCVQFFLLLRNEEPCCSFSHCWSVGLLVCGQCWVQTLCNVQDSVHVAAAALLLSQARPGGTSSCSPATIRWAASRRR
jgi:hypothetical protein